MKCYLLFRRALKFLGFIFMCCIISSVFGEVISEKSILLEFKSSVSDPSGILSSWDSSNSSDYCSWHGVSCDSNFRVFSLDISGVYAEGNSQASSCSKLSQFPYHGFGIRRICSLGSAKLVGTLSSVLGKLTELRVLSLPCNDLRGEIPLEVWGLENLEVLDVNGNLLTGELPGQFTGLRRLKVLDLGFNGISGGIPFSLSKCLDLEVLNLAGNRVNGTIPSFLGNFSKLQGLYMSQNKLTRSFPAEFGEGCLNLQHLDLSGNLLVGRIPSSLGNCQNLRTLLLFSNLFEDIIPKELGQLRMLEILDVSRNYLVGSIPASLGSCRNLSVLVLSNLFNPILTNQNLVGNSSGGLSSDSQDENNYFEGSIPKEITSLPTLRIFWAPRANLEGKLPGSWGDCDNLEMLNLAQNLFTGEIIAVFQKCKKLLYLDLSSNKITGIMDEELAVPCITFFDISGNLMSGQIPSFNYSVCPHVPAVKSDSSGHYDPSLAYFSFFTCKTHFKTGFPFTGERFPIIHSFGGNYFTGPIISLPIMQKLLAKQTVYAFLASGNYLNGSFPGTLFARCDELDGMIVNVSKNKLSGHIPLGIGTICRSLQILDASDNQISGLLPRSLGDLKALKYLSLAGNNLTGPIPSSFMGLRFLEVLKLSYNLLSGEIPQGLVLLRKLTVLLLNNNKFSGMIPSGLANLTTLSSFNVSFNNLSGSFPLKNNDVINCGSAIGNPLLYSCHYVSPATSSSEVQGSNLNSQSNADTQSGDSATRSRRLNSIELASIVSASAILLVLFALIFVFFYTRRRVPDSRVRVLESREITVFTDIGVPLTYESIVRATGNFSAGNCIGNGGFGATYKAEISSGMPVAVKRLAVGRFQGVQQFHAEIKTLERVRHRNLVTLIGYHASETEMFLIYNYLPGGNLEKFIKERSARAVDWQILYKIALDIARALAYLHDQCNPRVLHRDVKPSNILLDNDFNAYLSDFGLSRLIGTSETHATTGVAGTFGYVAPEYAMTCRVSDKADVYSYGVVLLELISDKSVLDPSFSSHGNGFNIVSWAGLQLRVGRAKEVFTSALWDTGPHDDLVELLHLAITCTDETLSGRPTMKQVVQRLKRMQPSSR